MGFEQALATIGGKAIAMTTLQKTLIPHNRIAQVRDQAGANRPLLAAGKPELRAVTTMHNRTRCKSGKPARWSPRTSTSPSASPARFNTWPG